MLLEYAAITHKGKVRSDNQDSFFAEPEKGLFAVADGMGGHQSGFLASTLAIMAVKKAALQRPLYSSKNLTLPEPDELIQDDIWLNKTFNNAASFINYAAANNENYKGLGSTLTVLSLNGLSVLVGHIGDSRAYQWRSGNLYQLTSDHNLATEMLNKGLIDHEEAEQSPQSNVLTRALCSSIKEVNPEFYLGDFETGDVFLLCSDGLYRSIGDAAILERLEVADQLDSIAKDLIDMANLAGGGDNITALLIRAF